MVSCMAMPIDIRDYTAFRPYLRSWFLEADGTPSQRAYAAEVGCSPALVSAILGGTRDLDPSSVSRWSRALSHDEDEARYFASLVDLDSPSRVRRDAAMAYVRAVRRFHSAEKVDDARLAVYLHWYVAAILELSGCLSFRRDPEWIASRLSPPITAAQAREALDVLVATGLLPEVGSAPTPPGILATATEIPSHEQSAAMREYFLGTLDRAADAMSRIQAPERHFTSILVSVPQAAVGHLKRRIADLERELIAYCDDLQDRERVYQLAFLLFPASRSTLDDGEGEGEP